MRRSLITTTGIVALTLVVPSAALAHHGHGHHHHKARGKAHHARFRHVHIGAGATGTTTSPTPENAGTVASYTGGVLTLSLNGGSTVSGTVTVHTRIRCVPAIAPTVTTPTSPAPGDDEGQGDDRGSNDVSAQGDRGPGDWHHENGDDESPRTSEPPCDSSTLVAGAVVRAAQLRIGPGASEFESVWLVR
jgi:hypothetical protein